VRAARFAAMSSVGFQSYISTTMKAGRLGFRVADESDVGLSFCRN
jgi:hypothetical protein